MAVEATQTRLLENKTLRRWISRAFLVSILVYWSDKRAAETGRWRVRETSLHVIDAIGGIAGGLIAQQLLRHKTSKRSFIVVTVMISIGHIAALATLCLGIGGIR